MEPVKVTLGETSVVVDSPYNPDFPPRARALGGSWSGSVWAFNARDEQRVRDLCVEIYGTDGTPCPTVDVLVDAGVYEGRSAQQSLILAGRQIATRPTRDAPVRLGQDVVITQGTFDRSGGSVRYPVINVVAGEVILEVRGVPAAHPDTRRPGVTVLTGSIDVAALSAERERLVARIAEIDDLVAQREAQRGAEKGQESTT